MASTDVEPHLFRDFSKASFMGARTEAELYAVLGSLSRCAHLVPAGLHLPFSRTGIVRVGLEKRRSSPGLWSDRVAAMYGAVLAQIVLIEARKAKRQQQAQLYKMSNSGISWNKRWVVLDNNHLAYFDARAMKDRQKGKAVLPKDQIDVCAFKTTLSLRAKEGMVQRQ